MADIEYKGLQAGKIPVSYILKSFIQPFATSIIPPEEEVKGIDTSKWNGDMNYSISKNAGAKFVYTKATQGISAIDLQFNNNRNKLKGLLPWGAYHYLLSTYSGTSQANFFCDTLGTYPGELPPVVDVKQLSISATIIKDFCLVVRARLGWFPLIYTSVNFWDKVYGATDKLWCTQNCDLFVAHWGTNNPLIPPGWTDCVIQQYSADGNGLGVTYGAPPPPLADYDMDLDRTRRSWLEQFIIPTQPTAYPKVEVIVDSLNIRSGPSTSSSVIGGLVKGNRPEKLETYIYGSNIWIRIGWKQWAAMIYNGITYMRDI